MKSRFAVFAMALLASCALLAATRWVDIERRLSAEQMHATGLDTLSAGQLALLNRLLREGDAAEAATAPAQREQDPTRLLGFNDAPIVSRLVGTLSGWEPGTEFELANGQRWKVLKGRYTLPKPLEAPEVKVAPGAAGRWFFRIDEDTPGARVYRVD
jgi:hypothetical protein